MKSILFSQMEPPPQLEDEFNDWYDTEHVPIRLALDGMLDAHRYVAVSGTPKYLAVYEAQSLDLFHSEPFHAIRKNPSERTRRMLKQVTGFTRFVCVEISDTGSAAPGSFLSVNGFAVPAAARAQFDDWYETEHIPRLMRSPDWLRVRRYEVTEGEGGDWTHLALHELARAEAMDSPERAAARMGPKRDQFVGQPWFDTSGRWLYKRIPGAPRK